MATEFRLLMISAMYENGGNTHTVFSMDILRCLCIRSSHSSALDT